MDPFLLQLHLQALQPIPRLVSSGFCNAYPLVKRCNRAHLNLQNAIPRGPQLLRYDVFLLLQALNFHSQLSSAVRRFRGLLLEVLRLLSQREGGGAIRC